MDGKDVLRLPIYPPLHGTFRPFQMYCLVFGLLLVSRLLQYSKHQKVDTYSHVKHMFEQMYVPIFPKNGESREQMVLSKTPIKNNVWKRPSTWSIFWMRMWVSVTNFANKKISNMLEVEVVFWYNCTHVMVVPVVQSTILDEMNSPMRQKNNGPGCEPLKAVIVSLRGYWGPPFDLIRNVKYIATYFWKLEAYPDGHATNSPKIGGFLFCEI